MCRAFLRSLSRFEGTLEGCPRVICMSGDSRGAVSLAMILAVCMGLCPSTGTSQERHVYVHCIHIHSLRPVTERTSDDRAAFTARPPGRVRAYARPAPNVPASEYGARLCQSATVRPSTTAPCKRPTGPTVQTFKRSMFTGHRYTCPTKHVKPPQRAMEAQTPVVLSEECQASHGGKTHSTF